MLMAKICRWAYFIMFMTPDDKVHGANMSPTWVLTAPEGPHVGPMNLAIRDITYIPILSHSSIMKSVTTQFPSGSVTSRWFYPTQHPTTLPNWPDYVVMQLEQTIRVSRPYTMMTSWCGNTSAELLALCEEKPSVDSPNIWLVMWSFVALFTWISCCTVE